MPYNEMAVLWVTNEEIKDILKNVIPTLTEMPTYLRKAFGLSDEIKARPHIINLIAEISDAFLPCLCEEKITSCRVTARIYAHECVGIIIKGDDIERFKFSPGFITDFGLSPISA